MKASDILKDEHRLIARLIAVVEEGKNQISAERPVPAEFLDNVTEFFWDFVLQFHFEKEEELLFEELENAGIHIEELPIEAFRYEHQVLYDYFERMRKELYEFNSGCDSREDCERKQNRFLKDLEIFLQMLRRHAIREERVLYPMCDRLISERGDRKLQEYFLKKGEVFREYYTKFEDRVRLYEEYFNEVKV